MSCAWEVCLSEREVTLEGLSDLLSLIDSPRFIDDHGLLSLEVLLSPDTKFHQNCDENIGGEGVLGRAVGLLCSAMPAREALLVLPLAVTSRPDLVAVSLLSIARSSPKRREMDEARRVFVGLSEPVRRRAALWGLQGPAGALSVEVLELIGLLVEHDEVPAGQVHALACAGVAGAGGQGLAWLALARPVDLGTAVACVGCLTGLLHLGPSAPMPKDDEESAPSRADAVLGALSAAVQREQQQSAAPLDLDPVPLSACLAALGLAAVRGVSRSVSTTAIRLFRELSGLGRCARALTMVAIDAEAHDEVRALAIDQLRALSLKGSDPALPEAIPTVLNHCLVFSPLSGWSASSLAAAAALLRLVFTAKGRRQALGFPSQSSVTALLATKINPLVDMIKMSISQLQDTYPRTDQIEADLNSLFLLKENLASALDKI
jgi:hypothetical protein